MEFAISLAFKKGLINEAYKNESLELIAKYNLIKNQPKFDQKKLVELMKSDKKVEDGNIKFILPVNQDSTHPTKSYVECFDLSPKEIF